MHLSKSALFLAAASTAMAGSVHMRHAQYHNRRAVGDLVVATIDGKLATWTNTYAGPTAAPAAPASSPIEAPAAAAAPAAAPAAAAPAAAASVVSSYTAFANCKRDDASDEAFAGNLGKCGFASNIMLVADDLEDTYSHTVKIVNQLGGPALCGCGNKDSASGQLNGFFGQPPHKFNLAHGETQVVALDVGSIGFCTCAAGDISDIPLTEWGQIMGTELEFEMSSLKNSDAGGGTNGADLSIIAAMNNQQHGGQAVFIPGQACVDGYGCSTIGADGSITNAYDLSNQAQGGVGMNIPSIPNVSVVYTLGA